MIELQGITAQERRAWLSQLLESGIYTVTFVKVDGSVRNMPCTLDPAQLPELPPHVPNTTDSVDFPRTKKINPETLSVWCVDKKQWRSFRVMNVTTVAEYQPKQITWIVNLEEDPETGDLIMPIPSGVLESQGWQIGDTLDWDFDKKNQTIVLSKKK